LVLEGHEMDFDKPFILYELFLAVCQPEEPIRVDPYDVSGLEPSIVSEGILGCFRVISVFPNKVEDASGMTSLRVTQYLLLT
jgi:hypothetical protein